MNITIDTTKIQDPNEFGELLRKEFFVKGKGYPGYYHFELRNNFIKAFDNSAYHNLIVKKYNLYWGLGISYNEGVGYENTGEVKVYIDKNNNNIFVAWLCDGDTILILSDGDRVIINNDAKKSYNWKWWI